jgi:hypothetical protein
MRAEQLAELPGVLVGSPQQIADTLLRYREEFGITYIGVLEDHMRAFAEVIPLRGDQIFIRATMSLIRRAQGRLVGGRLRGQVRCLPPPSPGSPTAVCALQHHAVPSRWLLRHRKPSTAPRWSGAGRQGCRPSGRYAPAYPQHSLAEPGLENVDAVLRQGSRRARAISRGCGGPVLGDGGRQLRRGPAGRRMPGGPPYSPWRNRLSSRSIRPPRPGPRCVRTRSS